LGGDGGAFRAYFISGEADYERRFFDFSEGRSENGLGGKGGAGGSGGPGGLGGEADELGACLEGPPGKDGDQGDSGPSLARSEHVPLAATKDFGPLCLTIALGRLGSCGF